MGKVIEHDPTFIIDLPRCLRKNLFDKLWDNSKIVPCPSVVTRYVVYEGIWSAQI